MKNIIYTVLCILVIGTALGSCGGNSSSSKHPSDREVERVRDQLYKKGSDGLWYLK